MPTAITPTTIEFARADQQLRGDVAAEAVGAEPVRRRSAAAACSGCRSRPADTASTTQRQQRRPSSSSADQQRRRATKLGLRRSARRGSPLTASPRHPQPRVDHRIQHVDDEVDDHHHRRQQHARRRAPPPGRGWRWPGTPAGRAGQHEHVLDHDGAGDQVGELQAHDRQHRDHRVAQHVAPQHARGATGPWRARCARSPRAAPRAPPSASMRARIAACTTASATAGSSSACSAGPQAAAVVLAPAREAAGANHCSFTANSRISRIANQKFGIAMPSWLTRHHADVAGAVVARRGVDAEREREHHGQRHRQQRQRQRDAQPLGDQLDDRRVVGDSSCAMSPRSRPPIQSA